mmetsp:Transcript_46274/g.131416  ORF Transcript_46274/g.131416 Transcript_46274/m.131416 type:complete len:439 (+) Transcript_46274:51-1367(+)
MGVLPEAPLLLSIWGQLPDKKFEEEAEGDAEMSPSCGRLSAWMGSMFLDVDEEDWELALFRHGRRGVRRSAVAAGRRSGTASGGRAGLVSSAAARARGRRQPRQGRTGKQGLGSVVKDEFAAFTGLPLDLKDARARAASEHQQAVGGGVAAEGDAEDDGTVFASRRVHFGETVVLEVEKVGRITKGITWKASAKRIECDGCEHLFPRHDKADFGESYIKRLRGIQEEEMGGILCRIPRYFCTDCRPEPPPEEPAYDDDEEEFEEGDDDDEDVDPSALRRPLPRRWADMEEEDEPFGPSAPQERLEAQHGGAPDTSSDEVTRAGAAAVLAWSLEAPSRERLRKVQAFHSFMDHVFVMDVDLCAESFCLNLTRDIQTAALDCCDCGPQERRDTLVDDLDMWFRGDAKWCQSFLCDIASEYSELYSGLAMPKPQSELPNLD